MRGEFETRRVEEARYGVRIRGRPGCGVGGVVTTYFPVIGGAGGLSPAAEGRKDGRKDGEPRLSWRGWPTAERLAQIAVTYRKVGVGRIIAPILKRGGKTALVVMVCHKTSTTAAQLT